MAERLDDEFIDAMTGDTFDRLMRFRNAWQVYDNDVTPPLKVRDNAPDDNLLLPLMRTFVQKSRSFLVGQGFTTELGDLRGTPGDDYLTGLLRELKYPQRALRQATNGGVTGHNFVHFVPDPRDRASLQHRLVVLDPSDVTPVWSVNDHEDVWAWRIRVNTRDPQTGRPMLHEKQIVRNDTGDSWTITEYQARIPQDAIDGKGQFIPRRDQRFEWSVYARPVVWGYEWAPIFHNQNLPAANEFWGESDITRGVQDLAMGLNRLASNTNRIIRHHAHPKTIGVGIEVDDWNNDIDEVTLVPEGTNVYNLEMQSDMGSTLAFFDKLLDLLHMAARVPRIATDKVDGVGALSGVAIQLLFAPLLELTADKRATFGPMQEQMFERVLEFAGFDLGGQIVTVQFPSPLPKDDKAAAETAVEQQAAGASKRTTLEQMGFDPEAEFANRAEEDAAHPDVFGIGDRMHEQAADGSVHGPDGQQL